MKTSELRIGNLVTVDNQDSWRDLEDIPLIVTAFNDKMDSQDLEFFPDSDGTVNLKSEYETYAQFSQFIKPIPLSEDILLKLGFRKSNSQNIMFLPIPKFGMEIHYEMHGYGNVVVIKSTTGSIIPNDIEYLHQIQNLFHSLTGEELTIKE